MAEDDAARYRANLQGEIDSAHLYRALAQSETDAKKSGIYEKLAAVEDQHAELWRENLKKLGAAVPATRPGFKSKVLSFLAGRFGPAFVLPTVNAMEKTGGSEYDGQPEAEAKGLPAVERSHAVVIGALAQGTKGETGAAIAKAEGRHRSMGGNALRAAVLGANDGLVSNLSLVMGVAGAAETAGAGGSMVLLTGLAGLIAGACSMAMGEWLSVNSARELYRHQAAGEAEELKQAPEEEREELALIYQAKGLSESEARALAARLMADEKTALDTLLREELGLDPDEIGDSPWAAAGWSFCLFAAGAIVPVFPFFFLSGLPAVFVSLGAGAAALAAIGAGTSLFTGRSAAFSAFRQIVIGLLAAAVTYGVGALMGVAIG
jgi:VIT1/CCC1 family predicted Fe2+/Mn2+ transporter